MGQAGLVNRVALIGFLWRGHLMDATGMRTKAGEGPQVAATAWMWSPSWRGEHM